MTTKQMMVNKNYSWINAKAWFKSLPSRTIESSSQNDSINILSKPAICINFLFLFETTYVTISIILKIVCLLISIAYYTLAERKIMAAVQRRKGPNVVGLFGLLQPLADGLKLLTKEMLIPTSSNEVIFLIAPIVILVLSLISWSIIPFGIRDAATFRDLPNNWIEFDKLNFSNHKFMENWLFDNSNLTLQTWLYGNNLYFRPYSTPALSDLYLNYNSLANVKYGVLLILAISSFNVYGIIIAGWASNSKYAFLGALRSAAQMISYEVSMGLIILPVIMLSGTLNLTQIVIQQEITGWFIFPLLPCAIIFFISMLAETNRTPFDLTEAEAELVAGYNTEYSSIIFAMFFLAEYSNMILMSALFTLFFLGGWLAPFSIFAGVNTALIFSIKLVFICFLFVLVRATFPRYRYDQLMNICWKIFLPISLIYVVIVALFLILFQCAPIVQNLPIYYI